jgi:hypothetical protein
VGARFGLGSGVTFQHYFRDHKVVEFIAYQRFGGINFTTLGEYHQQMFDVRGLKWFMGGGGHAWVYNKTSVLNEAAALKGDSGSYLALGVDGIVGIEYYMRGLPLMISVDWKPAFNLYGSRYIEWDSGGISLRYRF